MGCSHHQKVLFRETYPGYMYTSSLFSVGFGKNKRTVAFIPLVNGLNPGVSVVCLGDHPGEGKSSERLLLVTDVPTT